MTQNAITIFIWDILSSTNYIALFCQFEYLHNMDFLLWANQWHQVHSAMWQINFKSSLVLLVMSWLYISLLPTKAIYCNYKKALITNLYIDSVAEMKNRKEHAFDHVDSKKGKNYPDVGSSPKARKSNTTFKKTKHQSLGTAYTDKGKLKWRFKIKHSTCTKKLKYF